MSNCNPKSPNKYPKDVHCEGKAAIGFFIEDRFFTKGEQGKFSQLEGLDSKRNSDDGETENHTRNCIFYSYEKSAKNKPDNVPKDVH